MADEKTPQPKNQKKQGQQQSNPSTTPATTLTVATPTIVQPSDLALWVANLYDVSKITSEELNNWFDSFKYVGFDRQEVLLQLANKVFDIKLAQQIVLLCALRGPKAAANIKLTNGRTAVSYGIAYSGGKGTHAITLQRITAATADLAAFLLKGLKINKRIQSSDCPAWLQFPSAGSIKLPEDLRAAHLEFSKRFSVLIGGAFNEQIYSTMVQNSYLDPNLHLFD